MQLIRNITFRFISNLLKFPLLYKKFINTSVPEIFSCIRKSKMYSDFSDMNLLKISKSLFDKNCEIEFNPIFNNSQNEYIASSNNFKNIKKGDLIKTTLDTLNIGKLNTRIIKIPSNFSKRSEDMIKEIKSNLRDRKIKDNFKKENIKNGTGN